MAAAGDYSVFTTAASIGGVRNDGYGAKPEAADLRTELPLSADSGRSPGDNWSLKIDPQRPFVAIAGDGP